MTTNMLFTCRGIVTQAFFEHKRVYQQQPSEYLLVTERVEFDSENLSPKKEEIIISAEEAEKLFQISFNPPGTLADFIKHGKRFEEIVIDVFKTRHYATIANC